MFRAALRNLTAHRLRLLLSAMSIVLGVGFVSGSMIYTDTLDKTFSSLLDKTSSDVRVEAKAVFDTGPTGSGSHGAQTTLPETLVDDIAAVDGVAAAEGHVQTEGVYVLDESGEVYQTGGAPGVGVSWTDDERVTPARVAEGRAPTTEGEVALDSSTAAALGYRVGDRISVLTPGPRLTVELVGVFDYGDDGGLAGASMVAFDLETAQTLFLRPGQVTEINVAGSGLGDAALRDRIVEAIGTGYAVETRSEQTGTAAASIEEGLSFINTFLLIFAAVSLFVGSFIILNTFSMLVAQRTRELALLRALGSSRRQVTLAVLTEALVLGVLGATAGLAGGYGLAHGLRALMAKFGLTIDGDLVFAADTIAWSYAVGLGITLVSAYLPARRAARVAPVAAMREDSALPTKPLGRRAVGGTLTGLTGAVTLALALADGGSGTLIGVGAALLVVAAIALSPVLAAPFIRTAGAWAPRLAGRTGHLARENALRNPRRTAATSAALMVGLALVSGSTIVGASANASIEKLVGDTITADYILSAKGMQPFTTAVADDLRGVAEVTTVVQERYGTALFEGEQSTFSAFDVNGLGQVMRLDFVSGSVDALAAGGLLVDQPTARSRGWNLGDTVQFQTSTGQRRQLKIGGIYAENQGLSPYVVSMGTYQETSGVPMDRYVYLDVAGDSAEVAAARESIATVTRQYPVVDLMDRDEFVEEQQGHIKEMLTLINALLVLSIIIAVLGVINTLVLSVIERTRELGLLRAIGMSRRQLRRMVRLESVLIAVYGAVLGLALGVLLGVTMTKALKSEGIGQLVVPGDQLVLFLLLGALIGVLAAAMPARRAGRLQVLDAIAAP